MRSYALLLPDIKAIYQQFYKATYGKSHLDDKTKEFVAIAASLTSGCKGCLEGHLKKAKKDGATAEDIRGHRDHARGQCGDDRRPLGHRELPPGRTVRQAEVSLIIGSLSALAPNQRRRVTVILLDR